ncbi:regulatory protein [Antricoccus suffuscus]|uniref:Regulatory protein RecX n=1 Tax=Antricoccus suffuscus TaxID=1629062 RepID=A0A2T1A4Z2_9ACTN|nr:regulatory protein RecX [Antricoccus suffuscus]PRZ43624.1 regulatory protein [Antricoccus suffuscus]
MATGAVGARRGRSRPSGAEPPGLPTEPARLDALGTEFCLRKLTAMARTSHELRTAMQGKGYPDDSIRRVLARLTELRYVDDRQFAMMWVEDRHRNRGSSRTALRFELERKGVDRDLIDEALEQIDGAHERARAYQLASAKLRGAPARVRQDEEGLRRRLVGMLARRGYPAGLSYAAVDEALRDATDGTAMDDTAMDDTAPGDAP